LLELTAAASTAYICIWIRLSRLVDPYRYIPFLNALFLPYESSFTHISIFLPHLFASISPYIAPTYSSSTILDSLVHLYEYVGQRPANTAFQLAVPAGHEANFFAAVTGLPLSSP
jgi:hypothetical protein